jgi:starch synthase (maltosyl-transferring)
MLAFAGEEHALRSRCRVLCVIAGMPAGGAERQLALLLDGLDRRAFEPGLLIFNAAEKVHYRQIFERDVWFRALGLSGTSAARLLWPMLAGIDRAVRDFAPDVVFATLNVANHAVRASRLLFRWDAPIVTSVRVSYRDGYSRKEKLAERLLRHQSASIICNAPATKVEMSTDLAIPESRIAYVPNGIDPAFFSHGPFEKPPWWPEGRVALTIGRFSDQKNHIGLVSALEKLCRRGLLGDRRFVFVGEGPRKADIHAAIVHAGLSDRIVVHAPVSDPMPLYAASELVIIPSHFEGMPNVALEAQAAARPVAISLPANSARVVTDEDGFVLGPDLAHSLANVLALPHDVLRLRGESARARMLRDYSAAAMIGRFEDLLRRTARAETEKRSIGSQPRLAGSHE